ncbi:uncharacterized protein LOC107802797 [Nicotiana tabacum]|uniref:Uncharacterized protein LOC107802797 n=1 Tax=Nicotiana tabacum TaxID=4097 RepID=A0A1S4AZ58_TOBAC|nr:PREDICTED: uncharacterized protein LOC107802797 [Nicotiana tabacum]
MVEVYFEHLDSYIGKTIHTNEVSGAEQEKEVNSEHSLTDDEFEDSENDFSEYNENVNHRHEVSEEVKKKMAAEEGDIDCVDSDDTKSLDCDSDSESFNFPMFNPKTDGDKPVLALELTFENKHEFKYSVITHEVNEGKYIKWCKNDNSRVKANCGHLDCKWEILASRMHRDRTFQIRTYNPTHDCKIWNHRNKAITSSYIAQRYLKAISSNGSWAIGAFRDHVSVELRVQVTLSQCRRAKKKALALIDGDINAQYKVLWNYCNEIRRTNPNTSVYMKFVENEVPDKPKRFQRIYICFSSCKEGFKSGCRRIIGVDGCWLKGPIYGTQLLTAVGLDPNNNIFPIAYAIVEKERKESWEWFLNYLKLDLDIDNYGTWTFMSDKQKGLIKAFNEVLPYVSHLFCVRHLHNNFKRTGFSSISLRNALWKAAKATTVKWFEDCMVDIFDIDSEAVHWLKKKSPTEWSKSHFFETVKYDTLLNNMCECFNSMIIEARDKLIITLLEKLRYHLMTRMQANRDKGTKWNDGDICPRIKNVLHKNQAKAAEFITRKSNEWNYEIIGASIMNNWDVDLLNRKCSCRKWDLTGISCKHAIAAIWAKHDDINSYVDDCYKVETYRMIYAFSILPMNGQEMWPKSNNVPLLPPRLER